MNETVKEQVEAAQSKTSVRQDRNFLHTTFLFYGLGLLFLLAGTVVWMAYDALLLVFACILVAVLLYDLSCRLMKWLPVPRGVALGLVVLLFFLVLGLGGWLMAPQVAQQANELADAVPKSFDRLRTALEEHKLLRSLAVNLPSTEKLMERVSSVLPQAGLFFSGMLGVIGNVAIIAFVGTYFAAQPRVYIDGAVTLVPHRKRERVRQVIEELGATLGQWLFGKMVSMLIVGVVTGVGLALLGVPLALVLGILAGLLDFIPYLGPIMAGVPAVLLALSESPTQALYVILLFLGVQVLEGYLLLPLIERRTVSLPPALTIIMQVLLGTVFGLAGVALATPLTAVLMVVVTMLYVQDVLGDPVKTPSEQ
ncbi:MAG TPA: AI-2E family transporter [Anaerolineaceae bacterium]|nr:AI-2E family transporter [Anaerolineaceae bacterium]